MAAAVPIVFSEALNVRVCRMLYGPRPIVRRSAVELQLKCPVGPVFAPGNPIG